MHEIEAAVLRGPGELSVESLTLDDPGRNEVLVDIRATGVCGTDVHAYHGNTPAPYPVVLGHESAGVVVETGPGVSDLDPGEHVVLAVITHCGHCAACERGEPYHCEGDIDLAFGGTLPGGERRLSKDGEPINHFFAQSSFATKTVVPAQTAVPLPRDVPFAAGALLGCGAATGIGAVYNTAAVEPGGSVAVFGCGGVGTSAVLAANSVGATPLIAVDIDPVKRELGADLGATHTVDPAADDPVERIRDLTDGGVTYAFECIGNTTVMEQAIAATREGGTATLVGAHHGDDTITVDPTRDVLPGGKTIRGCVAGSMRPAVDIPRYARLYERSALDLDALVSQEFGLGETERAVDAFESGEGIRNVVRLDK